VLDPASGNPAALDLAALDKSQVIALSLIRRKFA
jgi:hypothetical protein